MQHHLPDRLRPGGQFAAPAACGLLLLMALALPVVGSQSGTQSAAAPKTPPAVGTVKSISGNTLTLTTDSGAELKVQLPPDVKLLRVPPGSTRSP